MGLGWRTGIFWREIVFDLGRPVTIPRKLFDVARLSGMGWRQRMESDVTVTMGWGRRGGCSDEKR